MLLRHMISKPYHYGKSGRYRGFTPKGNPVQAGKRLNPELWGGLHNEENQPVLTARIIVGFNVGPKPKWTIKNVIPKVRKFLKLLGMPQDSSYLHQSGVFTHRDGDEEDVVTERGTQIIILKLPGTAWDKITTESKFIAVINLLAEQLCDDLIQKEIVTVFSKGGKDIATYGIIGTKPYPEAKLFAHK